MQRKDSKGYTIPSEKVTAGTNCYDDTPRQAARDLHLFLSEHDIAVAEAAKLIKKPKSGTPYTEVTIYNFLVGANGNNSLGNVTKGVVKYLEIERAQRDTNRAPFVETNLAKTIFDVCTAAKQYQKFGFVTGENQTGKTEALKEHAKRHGEAIYVRCPAFGNFPSFIRRLATALGIATERRSVTSLEADIFATVDSHTLIMIDQAHECFRTGTIPSLRVLIWLLDLHDERRPGVVLCGTREFDREIQKGKHRILLEQVWNRRSPVNIVLPDLPTRQNLNQFAKHYGLPQATGEDLRFQNRIVEKDRLGVWLSILQAADKFATKRGTKITWKTVAQAYASLQTLSKAS